MVLEDYLPSPIPSGWKRASDRESCGIRQAVYTKGPLIVMASESVLGIPGLHVSASKHHRPVSEHKLEELASSLFGCAVDRSTIVRTASCIQAAVCLKIGNGH